MLLRALVRRFERLRKQQRDLIERRQDPQLRKRAPALSGEEASQFEDAEADCLGAELSSCEGDILVVVDYLSVVLDAIVVVLVSPGGAQRNPELIYALLQHHEMVDALHGSLVQERHSQGHGGGQIASRTQSAGLLQPLEQIRDALSFFSKKLEDAHTEDRRSHYCVGTSSGGPGGGSLGATSDWDVARVMRVVVASTLYWRPPSQRMSQGGGVSYGVPDTRWDTYHSML